MLFRPGLREVPSITLALGLLAGCGRSPEAKEGIGSLNAPTNTDLDSDHTALVMPPRPNTSQNVGLNVTATPQWTAPGFPECPNRILVEAKRPPPPLSATYPWTVIATRVIDVSTELLQFDLQVPGPLPFDTSLGFLCSVDTDHNPNTGQKGPAIGSDCNIRADWEQGRWQSGVGRVGGRSAVFCRDNIISIRVPRSLLGNPKNFGFVVHSYATRDGKRLPAPNIIGVIKVEQSHIAGELATMSEVLFKPSVVSLSEGSGETRIDPIVINAKGEVVSNSKLSVELQASRPSLLTIEKNLLKARPQIIGEVDVIAKVNGIVSSPVRVGIGSGKFVPPVMYLPQSGSHPEKIRVALQDAIGTPIPEGAQPLSFLSDRADSFTVSPDGAISVKKPFEEHDLYVSVNGKTLNNRAILTTWDSRWTLPVQPAVQVDGRYTTISYVPSMRIRPDMPTFGQTVTDYEVLGFTDAAYGIMTELAGPRLSPGKLNYAVVMRPGGGGAHSGNPIVLQVSLANPNDNCFQYSGGKFSGAPMFWAILHETGHVFTLPNQQFSEFVRGPSPSSIAWREGFATMCYLYTARQMLIAPEKHHLSARTMEVVKADFESGSANFLNKGQNWIRQGRNMEKINPDIADGLLLELTSQYGWQWLPKFFGTFRPREPLPCKIEGVGPQCTLLAAACSIACENDLRPWFRQRCGFQIDDSFYQELTPHLLQNLRYARLERERNPEPGSK